jgi:trehalose/maltose transport system substrate-binding protein
MTPFTKPFKSLVRRVPLALMLALMIGAFIPAQAQDDAPDVTCPEGSPNLVIAAGAIGLDLQVLNAMLADYMALCPNVTASALESPDLVTDRRGLYIQFLGAKSPAVDIYAIDVIWPAIMAEHMVDLYEYFPLDSKTILAHFPSTIQNNTIDGRLIGMPWYIDAGLLYYRTDLLEKYGLDVPTTWDEMAEAAEIIQTGERAEGNTEFWGYVWQGNIGEPTLINALEWQASNGGGQIISPEGEIQVNNAETISAIERGAGWVGSISPETVLGHTPGDTNNIWQAGNAAFMRNWLFGYSLTADNPALTDRFDATLLPQGDAGINASVLGGWQLAVSSYSQNIPAAVALVEYLTSYTGQKYRALTGGYNPTIQALYEDAELLEASPLFARIGDVLSYTVPRPSSISGDAYGRVSELYSGAVHSVLRGQLDARTAMEDLEFELEDLLADVLED